MQRRTFLASLAAGLVGLVTFRKAVAAPAPTPKPVAPPPKLPEFYSGTWNVDYLELPPYREVSETREIEKVYRPDGTIESMRPVPGSERTSIYYKDAFAMFEDIRRHVASTGESVIPSDDPMNSRLGFTNEPGTMWWGIKVQDLFASLAACKPKNAVKALLIREYVKTPKGRARLAQTLSENPKSTLVGIKYVKPGVYC